jgi:hypothetical protein
MSPTLVCSRAEGYIYFLFSGKKVALEEIAEDNKDCL